MSTNKQMSSIVLAYLATVVLVWDKASTGQLSSGGDWSLRAKASDQNKAGDERREHGSERGLHLYKKLRRAQDCVQLLAPMSSVCYVILVTLLYWVLRSYFWRWG